MTKNHRILTFRKSDGRWSKRINGRVEYFGRGSSINDEASYQLALRRYRQRLIELAQPATESRPWDDLTVADIADQFLQDESARQQRNEISANHFARTLASLKDFVGIVGADRLLSDGMELIAAEYARHTRALPISKRTNKPIGPATAKHRLDAVKAMFAWAYRHGLTERELRNRKDLTMKLSRPDVKIFSAEELRLLLKSADPRLRCWMLLALNIGAGQKDIADLKVDEISLDPPEIRRGRSKTGVEGVYALWPETVRALVPALDEGGGEDGRLFFGQRGRPLVWSEMRDDKLFRGDAIRNRFERLIREDGMPKGRSFYSLRRTSANLIAKIDEPVARLFLAHSDPTMGKHYIVPDWPRLAAAIGKLRDVLGIGQVLGNDA